MGIEAHRAVFRLRGVRIIFFVVKKGFHLNAAREFRNVLLTENSSVLFGSLLRTYFSESESVKFSGKATTVLRLSSVELLVI